MHDGQLSALDALLEHLLVQLKAVVEAGAVLHLLLLTLVEEFLGNLLSQSLLRWDLVELLLSRAGVLLEGFLLLGKSAFTGELMQVERRPSEEHLVLVPLGGLGMSSPQGPVMPLVLHVLRPVGEVVLVELGNLLVEKVGLECPPLCHSMPETFVEDACGLGFELLLRCREEERLDKVHGALKGLALGSLTEH
jgi:hypothetical protein